MTDLDLLEQQYGKVTAYDGRSVFWTNLGVFDIRDAAASGSTSCAKQKV